MIFRCLQIPILLCALLFIGTVSAGARKNPNIGPQMVGRVVVRIAVMRQYPQKSALVIARISLNRHVQLEDMCNGYFRAWTPDAACLGWVPAWQVKVIKGQDLLFFYASQTHNPITGEMTFPEIPKSHAGSGYQLSPAQNYINRVSFLSTRDAWWKAETCNGYIHFKNAAVVNDEFSADIAIGGGVIKATTKPVEVDFAVTVFDPDGNVTGRGTASIYNVDSNGGEYVLSGPMVSGEHQSAQCSIKLSGIWTRKG